MEISPSQDNIHDNFFVVMDISETSSTVFNGISEKVFVQSTLFEGAVLNNEFLVLFNKYNNTEGRKNVLTFDKYSHTLTHPSHISYILMN